MRHRPMQFRFHRPRREMSLQKVHRTMQIGATAFLAMGALLGPLAEPAVEPQTWRSAT